MKTRVGNLLLILLLATPASADECRYFCDTDPDTQMRELEREIDRGESWEQTQILRDLARTEREQLELERNYLRREEIRDFNAQGPRGSAVVRFSDDSYQEPVR